MIKFTRSMKAIQSWFDTATGLKSRWTYEPETNEEAPHGILELKKIESVGTDESRQFTKPDGTVGFEICGQRMMTIELRVRSRSQKPDDFSPLYMESALQSTSAIWALSKLHDADVAIVDWSDMQHMSAPFDDRNESIALVEMRFAVVSVTVDARNSAGVIEHAEITSTLTDASGTTPPTLLPTPLQLADEVMPP